MPNMPSVKNSAITLATEKPREPNSRSGSTAYDRRRAQSEYAGTSSSRGHQRAEHPRVAPAVVVAVDDAPDAEEHGAAEQQRADRVEPLPGAARLGDRESSSGTATSATGR